MPVDHRVSGCDVHAWVAVGALLIFQEAQFIPRDFATITIAEVLTGPLNAGNEALVKRYRAVLELWQVIEFTADIAASAARLRASLKIHLRPQDRRRLA